MTPTPTRTQTLVDRLRREIVEGRIAPGEKLPSESALISRYGVSRTVVREAVSRLQAEGLVHTRRGSGSFALAPPPERSAGWRVPRTPAERRQLLQFRSGLESEAAALAARAQAASPGGADALRMLDAALADFEASGSSASAAMAADYEFHRSVAQASGNPYFTDAVAGLGPAMIAMPRGRLEAGEASADDRLAHVAAEHRAVRNAIAAGDPLAAAAAMRVHLANSARRLSVESGTQGL